MQYIIRTKLQLHGIPNEKILATRRIEVFANFPFIQVYADRWKSFSGINFIFIYVLID